MVNPALSVCCLSFQIVWLNITVLQVGIQAVLGNANELEALSADSGLFNDILV